jgi:signal transduction histidine kinase
MALAMPHEENEEEERGALAWYRRALAWGAGLYLLWWAFVQALLPGSFNPFLGRLLVVALCGAVLGATFVSRWVARRVAPLFAACMWTLTLHYFYLLHGNRGDATWWAGCVVVVAAVGALLSTRGALVAYSIFTLASTLGLMALERHILDSIFLPSIATVLFLSNVALRSRLRAAEERHSAIEARLERDRAREASEFKSMFLALVSHELVTPLQSLRLNADILARLPEAKAPSCANAIEKIGRGQRRLADLIESLLEYSRIEAGRLEVHVEDLDLAALVSDTVEDLAPQAQAKALDFRLRIEPGLPCLRSDRRIVRLLVANLVANAVKYTERGGVEIEVARGASGPRISVQDSGRGIPAADHARVFEAFTQLEPISGKHLPGLGLGLALVKQMADAIGAQVEMQSVVGKGSTFTVVLPTETKVG